MRKPNAYLQKREIVNQTYLDVGEQFGMQKMWDYPQVVLSDPEVMSKDTFGAMRMDKIFQGLKVVANRYHVAFTADKEADYYQEDLDARLRKIHGDKLVPFYERYPELKKFNYNKARKEWK